MMVSIKYLYVSASKIAVKKQNSKDIYV